jgi:hypothetical protein
LSLLVVVVVELLLLLHPFDLEGVQGKGGCGL